MTASTNSLTTLKQYCNDHQISKSLLQYLIYQNHIHKQGFNHQTYLYDIAELNEIVERNNHKKAHHQKQSKQYHKLQKSINTKHLYNAKVDYSPYHLSKYLGQVSSQTILNWIKKDAVPFSLDTNGKFFFTPEQAKRIKSAYKNIPNGYISNKALAKKLDIPNHQLTRWAHYYMVENIRVLGYMGVFYSPEATMYILKNY